MRGSVLITVTDGSEHTGKSSSALRNSSLGVVQKGEMMTFLLEMSEPVLLLHSVLLLLHSVLLLVLLQNGSDALTSACSRAWAPVTGQL